MRMHSCPKFVLSTIACIFSAQSYASFMYVEEQSVSAMGNAFAGAGAAGDDVSIGFYNPAGLTLIKEGEVVGALTYAATDIVLNVDSATDTLSAPIPGAAGAEYFAVPQTPIPALHAAVPITQDLVIGMNLTAPFWGVADYSDTLVRDATNEINMTAYNANFSLAYKLMQKLSIGAGLNAQYFNAKYDVYLSGALNHVDQTFGYLEYRGDDFVVYPNVGLLYEFTDKTRVGLSYRFPVTQDTEGTFKFQIMEIGQSTQAVPFDASLDVPLPGLASLSFFHALTPKIELLADVTFEEWSRWQNFTIKFDTSHIPDPQDPFKTPSTVPLNFVDTWRFALGANYILNNAIKFRSGIAYDQSPVQDEYRLTATPDSDQFDISIGMGITPKSWDKTAIDIAYMHTFFASAPITQQNILNTLNEFHFPNADLANNVYGEFDSAADFIGIQIVRKM